MDKISEMRFKNKRVLDIKFLLCILVGIVFIVLIKYIQVKRQIRNLSNQMEALLRKDTEKDVGYFFD